MKKLFTFALLVLFSISAEAVYLVATDEQVKELIESGKLNPTEQTMRLCTGKANYAGILVYDRENDTLEKMLKFTEVQYYAVPEKDRAPLVVYTDTVRMVRDAYKTKKTPKEFAEHEFYHCLYNGY